MSHLITKTPNEMCIGCMFSYSVVKSALFIAGLDQTILSGRPIATCPSTGLCIQQSQHASYKRKSFQRTRPPSSYQSPRGNGWEGTFLLLSSLLLVFHPRRWYRDNIIRSGPFIFSFSFICMDPAKWAPTPQNRLSQPQGLAWSEMNRVVGKNGLPKGVQGNSVVMVCVCVCVQGGCIRTSNLHGANRPVAPEVVKGRRVALFSREQQCTSLKMRGERKCGIRRRIAKSQGA